MNSGEIRDQFLETFSQAGFRKSPPLSLLQPTITTSFLFSVGFVDVMEAIAGNAVELDGAATVQRCFRHFDIERVADGRHLSFFEMAGVLCCRQWRIDDLVQPLIEYLVRRCGLAKERLHVTYFGGGKVAGTSLSPDDRAKEAYLAAEISKDRIWAGDRSSNIWFEGTNSGTERSGICGPNSELFLELDGDSNGAGPLNAPERYIELTNIVAITHRKGAENNIEELPAPLVELAAGMERIEMAIRGFTDVYQTQKLRSIADAILSCCSSPVDVMSEQSNLNIIADHVRALTHLIADGGRPGPKGRGHVVRRLFRRLLHASSSLHLDVLGEFPKLAGVVCDVDDPINPNLSREMPHILEIFDRETKRMSMMPV